MEDKQKKDNIRFKKNILKRNLKEQTHFNPN